MSRVKESSSSETVAGDDLNISGVDTLPPTPPPPPPDSTQPQAPHRSKKKNKKVRINHKLIQTDRQQRSSQMNSNRLNKWDTTTHKQHTKPELEPINQTQQNRENHRGNHRENHRDEGASTSSRAAETEEERRRREHEEHELLYGDIDLGTAQLFANPPRVDMTERLKTLANRD